MAHGVAGDAALAVDAIYEYACHEGNYGMSNILSAARADDSAGSART